MTLTTQKNTTITELHDTQQLCKMLMASPHYSRIGAEGIFAIVETAKSLGIDQRLALSGGLYYQKGKVEMSARLMNSLIRSQKHSITRDKKSDSNICILHGRRSDNGDTWTESFSMEEAKAAGLLIRKKDRNTGAEINGPWQLFPRDMLFARALSRLARQLFPDIIGNVYVEGEIQLDASIPSPDDVPPAPVEAPATPAVITEIEARELEEMLASDPTYKGTLLNLLKNKCDIDGFNNMPREVYEKVLARIQRKKQEDLQAEYAAVEGGF